MELDEGGPLLRRDGVLPAGHHLGDPLLWLYFADQKLKWNGAGPNGFWLKELRDAVAMGLVTGPIITVLVGAAIMQNWRRKLRGATGDVRASGGYR